MRTKEILLSFKWKMASTKSLEDVLSSEVDESAVNALVGTLESQLGSTNATACSQQVLTDALINNHMKDNVVYGSAAPNRTQPQPVIYNAVQKNAVVNKLHIGSVSDTADNKELSLTSQLSNNPTTVSSTLQNSVLGYNHNPVHNVLASDGVSSKCSRNANSPLSSASNISNKNGISACASNTKDSSSPALDNFSSAGTAERSNLNGTVQSSTLSAIENLANVAAVQQPIMVSQLQDNKVGIGPLTGAQIRPTTNPVNASNVSTSIQQPLIVSMNTVTSQPMAVTGAQVVVSGATSVTSSGIQFVNISTVPRPGAAPNQQKVLAPRVILNTAPIRIAGSPGTTLQGPRPGFVQLTPGQSVSQGLIRGTVLLNTQTGQVQLLAPGLNRFQTTPGSTTAGGLGVTTVRYTVPASAVSSASSTLPAHAPSTTGSHSSSSVASAKMSPDTAKRKCKNFFATLIKLASSQPPDVAANVRQLIQGVIDGLVQPEDFTTKLESELKSSPQPFLIPFLKRSLPFLRQSLYHKEMTIDGVKPPPASSLSIPAMGAPLTLPTKTNRNRVVRPGQTVGQPHALTTKNAQALKPGSVASSTPTIAGHLKSRTPVAVPVSSAVARDKSGAAFRDDDDINDVAAMGGVNLMEETQRILASTTELVGTVERSCKDEAFLVGPALEARMKKLHHLEEPSSDVGNIISHATEQRLRNIIEKLGLIAEHRMEPLKMDPSLEEANNIRAQVKFLEELDKQERKRHEEQERELLLRLAKSRTKQEDPEQARLKQKAKEMQQAENELRRQKETNETARLALKRRKVDGGDGTDTSAVGASTLGAMSTVSRLQRPRTKRVNLRDLILLMEQERELSRSKLMYKTFFK